MTNYDLVQSDLVIQCEKPHEFGLRHTGISGQIIQSLMIGFLNIEFPHYNIAEGVVCDLDSKVDFQQQALTERLKSHLSPQLDIIFYRGTAWERLMDYVVVQKNNVMCALEIKKWDQQIEGLKDQIKIREEFLNCPVILVIFRASEEKRKLIKQEIGEESVFILSKSTGYVYPDYLPTEKWLNKGELERLVKRIKSVYDSYEYI